jgi:glycine cleavage system H protein
MDEAIRCTSEHEWVRVEEGLAVVGLTDYAQSELFGTIESVKSVSDIYSPISGEVKEANSELEAHPELVNQDPYHQGWIVKLDMDDPSEMDDLMTDAEYEEFISGGVEE